MPQNVWELPPCETSDDPVDRCEEELLSIVPRERTVPYRMHRLLELVFDTGSIFEIQPTFGQALITSLARLNGHPVGVIANNPMAFGGAMGAKEACKQTHFIELCDCFHIPLIFFVDIPGFMIGTAAEEEATLREGMKTVFAIHRVQVPIFTLVIRKCYGMAGMATCDKDGLDFKIAWPSGEWGSLPIEGGVAAAYRRDIASSENPAQREKELEDELRQFASPFRSAEAFAVEEIIDPRETRPLLCNFIALTRNRLKTLVGPTAKRGVSP